MVKVFSDPEAIAEDIIRDVGTKLVVGLPLGLGKANHIANALFARAVFLAEITTDMAESWLPVNILIRSPRTSSICPERPAQAP